MQRRNFKIENSIYSEKIIKKAVKDFKDFEVKYLNGILTVGGETGEEIDEIFNEFMNYVLGIQNELI